MRKRAPAGALSRAPFHASGVSAGEFRPARSAFRFYPDTPSTRNTGTHEARAASCVKPSNHPIIAGKMNQEVFAAVADALERGEMAALVTIVATTGSTPQRIGAKMLVFADGRMVGPIGGGCYENDAFWKAREA